MVNERMYGLGNEPSAIRELFAYGLQRKAEIGEDKVFDYSIGNPSIPAPQKVADTRIRRPPASPPCARPSPTASRAAPASTRRRPTCT